MAMETSPKNRKLGGWLRDKPDHRDKKFVGTRRKLTEAKAGQVDLRQWCSPVEDQGSIGSCVGNAIVGALELLRIQAGKPHIELSRLFVYYNSRLTHGAQDEDGGTYIRNAMGTLTSTGTCTESRWRYNPGNVFVRPDWNCYREAYANKIGSYESIVGTGSDLIDGIEESLSGGCPVVFGMMVDKNFVEKVTGSGVVPYVSNESRGAHATLIVGIDRSKGWIIGRNSWGESWGRDGYYFLPFEQLDEREAFDFWSVLAPPDYFPERTDR